MRHQLRLRLSHVGPEENVVSRMIVIVTLVRGAEALGARAIGRVVHTSAFSLLGSCSRFGSRFEVPGSGFRVRRRQHATERRYATGFLRDHRLIASLRARALGALVEMARWKSEGHALAAFWLLGRTSGLSEERIQEAWDRRDREAVIDAALKGP